MGGWCVEENEAEEGEGGERTERREERQVSKKKGTVIYKTVLGRRRKGRFLRKKLLPACLFSYSFLCVRRLPFDTPLLARAPSRRVFGLRGPLFVFVFVCSPPAFRHASFDQGSFQEGF